MSLLGSHPAYFKLRNLKTLGSLYRMLVEAVGLTVEEFNDVVNNQPIYFKTEREDIEQYILHLYEFGFNTDEIRSIVG